MQIIRGVRVSIDLTNIDSGDPINLLPVVLVRLRICLEVDSRANSLIIDADIRTATYTDARFISIRLLSQPLEIRAPWCRNCLTRFLALSEHLTVRGGGRAENH